MKPAITESVPPANILSLDGHNNEKDLGWLDTGTSTHTNTHTPLLLPRDAGK